MPWDSKGWHGPWPLPTYSNLSTFTSAIFPLLPILEKSTSFLEAFKHHEWLLAMNSKMDPLLKIEHGILFLLPTNFHGSKWILKNKHQVNGTLERHKARLMAQGFYQQHRLDYTDTFCPMVKPVTIHLLLSFAISSNWPLHQLDI